jgi:hypothetical protein
LQVNGSAAAVDETPRLVNDCRAITVMAAASGRHRGARSIALRFRRSDSLFDLGLRVTDIEAGPSRAASHMPMTVIALAAIPTSARMMARA